MPRFERPVPSRLSGAGEASCIVRDNPQTPACIVRNTSDGSRAEAAERQLDPTLRASGELTLAYHVFNERLFDGRLPACLITFQRHWRALGYFANRRFCTRDGDLVYDEIALNPDYFGANSIVETLSTLVHEMVHCEQQHFGRPSPHGYHNREFARLMRRVGLVASDSGKPGGQETGRKMDHYVDPAGPFARIADELIARGFAITFVDAWAQPAMDESVAGPSTGGTSGAGPSDRMRDARRASKTRFTCPHCHAAAWGKPGLRIDCRPCRSPMSAGGAGIGGRAAPSTTAIQPRPSGAQAQHRRLSR